MAKEIKVGCSPVTNTIYAGTVLKNGTWGADRTDVTEMAVPAVAQRLLQKNESMDFEYQNKRYRLQVIEVTE